MTTLGPNLIYRCPACKKHMKLQTYNSYTVHSSEAYSDGFSTGRPHMAPDFAKCPSCGHIFFRHNVKKKEQSINETGGIERIDEPDLDDLIAAGANIERFAKTSEEEMQIRTDLWRTLNDGIRRGKGFTKDTEAIWLDNCEALLNLHMQVGPTRPKNKAGYYLTVAELLRNLGRFDECLAMLDKLPSEYSWQKALFADRCAAKNRMVFELDATEGYRLRPRRGKGWHSWDCGADGTDSVLATIISQRNDLVFTGSGDMRDYTINRGGTLSTAPWCTPSRAGRYNRILMSDEITSIGAYAFYGSDYAGSAYLDADIVRIGRAAFSHSKIYHARIPTETVVVEDEAYSQCKFLKNVDIRKGLRHMGNRVFMGCDKLEKLHLPFTVRSVGMLAFVNCHSLTEIVLGRWLTDIGQYAFRMASAVGSKLVSVTNHNPVPQEIDAGHFMGNDLQNITLYVPPKSVEAYKKAEHWCEFGEIKAIEDNRQPWLIEQEEKEIAEEAQHQAEVAAEMADEMSEEMEFYEPNAMHVWVGTFESEEDLFNYALADFDEWVFFEKTYSALDILNAFGLESGDTLGSIERYMNMSANAGIFLYGCYGENVSKKIKSPRAVYLGEFYIAEPEDIVNEGRYDGEI